MKKRMLMTVIAASVMLVGCGSADEQTIEASEAVKGLAEQRDSQLSSIKQTPLPNDEQDEISPTHNWLKIAESLTDCSEIAFLEAWVLEASKETEFAPGLERAIEENEILSGRLRLLAAETAEIGGTDKESYRVHIMQRGPQYTEYGTNMGVYEKNEKMLKGKLESCQSIINENPQINKKMALIMKQPIDMFID